MRHDLDILQQLFLPMLEEIAAYSPTLATELARGEVFWSGFNEIVLRGGTVLQRALTAYGAKDAAQRYSQCESLTAEYIYSMAQLYCLGQTNPTIEALLQTEDARFAAEVSFQRDILAALAQVSRAELRAELEQAEAFAGGEMVDAEISAAFNTVDRNNLRSKLQQWDEEEPQREEPAKRKRRITMPLLFLRVAAAAAVFTGGMAGVMSLYNSGSNRDNAPAANSRPAEEVMSVARPGYTDSTVTAGAGQQNTMLQQAASAAAGGNNRDNRNNTAPQHAVVDTALINHTDSSRHSAPVAPITPPARLPHISLRGHIAETLSGDTVYNVMVTLADNQGNKQTQLSKDGTFHFELVPHRDYFIIGRREHYRSVPLTLSTKNVKDTDADDVITVTLKLEGDR